VYTLPQLGKVHLYVGKASVICCLFDEGNRADGTEGVEGAKSTDGVEGD
jgi:hypothetical protein